jgi:hypothetical protein
MLCLAGKKGFLLYVELISRRREYNILKRYLFICLFAITCIDSNGVNGQVSDRDRAIASDVNGKYWTIAISFFEVCFI